MRGVLHCKIHTVSVKTSDFSPHFAIKSSIAYIWLHDGKDTRVDVNASIRQVAFVKSSMPSGVAAELKCSYGHISICGMQTGEAFRHTSVLMWLHTKKHPLHFRWVHVYAGGWKEQVCNLASVSIPHKIIQRWAGCHLKPQQSGKGGTEMHTPQRRKKTGASKNPTYTIPQCATGETALSHQMRGGGKEEGVQRSSHMGANTYLIQQGGAGVLE